MTDLEFLTYDLDAREELIRKIVAERLAKYPPPRPDDHIVASIPCAFIRANPRPCWESFRTPEARKGLLFFSVSVLKWYNN